MELVIFAVFFIANVFFFYKSFSSSGVNSTVFFSFLSMAASFGLGALLQVEGLNFVDGVNLSTGSMVFVAHNAVNDLSIKVLAMVFILAGFIPIYRIFRVLESNGWKLGG